MTSIRMAIPRRTAPRRRSVCALLFLAAGLSGCDSFYRCRGVVTSGSMASHSFDTRPNVLAGIPLKDARVVRMITHGKAKSCEEAKPVLEGKKPGYRVERDGSFDISWTGPSEWLGEPTITVCFAASGHDTYRVVYKRSEVCRGFDVTDNDCYLNVVLKKISK